MSRVTRFRLVGVLLAGLLLFGAALLLPLHEAILDLLHWTAGRGAWTGVLLATLWIPAAILLVPGSILTLGTGFLLGVLWGTATVSVGSTLGAAAAFFVGRGLARTWVQDRMRERPRFRAVDEAVRREGLKLVFLTRLSPLFPYNFLNYAYSVTGVRFREFLLGSWIGMLPGTLMYAYLGSGARTLAAVSVGRSERTGAELALYAVGLAATVAATILVTRAARRALEERLEGRGT